MKLIIKKKGGIQMNRKRILSLILLFLFISSASYFLPDTLSPKSKNQINDTPIHISPLVANASNKTKVIVYFNSSSINEEVRDNFTSIYGGVFKDKWNDTNLSFSGFYGEIPTENFTLFEDYLEDIPGAEIEKNTILEAQMNYVAVQTGAVNSTWYQNGFMGDSNSSIAILDTGINANHIFFPKGYNTTKLEGNIVEFSDFINENSEPYDDNGHGTFLSSVISGTGNYSYNSTYLSELVFKNNYSHMDLFNEYTPSGNYSFKLFSFNISQPDSDILVNSSWELINTEKTTEKVIDKFWIELYNETELVNSTLNDSENKNYTINHNTGNSGNGIYDLYVKYHKKIQTKPEFSINISANFLPENYTQNFSHYTGIANGTKIVSHKVLNQSGRGFASNIISSLVNVSRNKEKSHIISVCLSLATFNEEVDSISKLIDELTKKGIIVVISVGNEGIKANNSLNKLAKNRNAIVVGATNDLDQITSYSSMGNELEHGGIKPDIVAPGGSTIRNHRSIIAADYNSNKTTAGYGTSISTAIVSGAINILIEAKYGNWDNWHKENTTQLVKIIKSILLMTASETNLLREDDPKTEENEANYSPPLSSAPLEDGITDIHEGYGRLNIQAAIDAFTKWMEANTTIEGNITSSQEDPLKEHVFARRITLTKDKQYVFNLTVEDQTANFDLLLFSNNTNQYGEPVLIQSKRGPFQDLDYFYFIPKKNETECIITVKALSGTSNFTLNVSTVENIYQPKLEIPEIEYNGNTQNTTVLSFREFEGENPEKNLTIDQYRFYIEYFDNDSSNVPPQEVYLSVKETGKNYTMNPTSQLNNNYSEGVIFQTNYIRFYENDSYHYFFVASDGIFLNQTGVFTINISSPIESKGYPYSHSFNYGLDGWKFQGNGWNLLIQNNTLDDRSLIYKESWRAVYFGTYHTYPNNYTYQPIILGSDEYFNGSLISPFYNLTDIPKDNQIYVKFGLRISINSGDFINVQINSNTTGWETLRTFTNIERDWFLVELNISDYIDSYVQFRFETDLDDAFDPIKYKGLMLDYFEISDYTNTKRPTCTFNISEDVHPIQDSEYQAVQFSCDYFDQDNNYPEYVYLEIGETNYSMINLYGFWKSNYHSDERMGIPFQRSIPIGEISNKSFRFHISDGEYSYSTAKYNENNSLFTFVNPTMLDLNTKKDGKDIGYKFSTSNLTDYYIVGDPVPKERTAWLRGDNTWHPVIKEDKEYLYAGRGISFGTTFQGYQSNWQSSLLTKPIYLGEEYNNYLEYYFDISLQSDDEDSEDNDKCMVSISKDYGKNWDLLKEYTSESNNLSKLEVIDISRYSGNNIMINFTLYSNDNPTGVGYGWLLSDIYLGYNRSFDFMPPKINFLNLKENDVIFSNVSVKVNISDNIGLDLESIQLYINGERIEKTLYNFNKNNSILTFYWDTLDYNDGIYEVEVVAYDKQGNKSESKISVEIDNGLINWRKWGPWIIFLGVSIGISVSLYLFAEKKGKDVVDGIKERYAEKIKQEETKKLDAMKKIKELEQEQYKKELTLHCKYCDSWFSSSKFDIVCPNCQRDEVYVAYNCINCGKWTLKDKPSTDYKCPNCEGVKLVRRDKEEIEEILGSKKRKVLQEFNKKKDKFSLLD
jgi:DNA-directed RNA polymerase subunit RPC12/RpoP